MNPAPTLGDWLQSFGSLALQCAIVLAIAGGAQAWLRSPRWRRTAWLAALAGLALLLVNALTGVDRQLTRWLTVEGKPKPHFIARGNLPVESSASLPTVSNSELRAASGLEPAAPDPQPAAPSAVWWPAWLWLAGTLVVALWAALPRLWLTFVRRRRATLDPPDTAQRVQTLATRLRLGGSIRVFASAKLAGPIAFGVRRPSVGLPADFWTANSLAEQDAMLAHELAHLAAQDPFWLALADALVAGLWWHPLVWWARRQFRVACETAADEASLVVEDGPAVLAGCLVALASRWQRHGVLGLLGMAGFRSHLGRRVERLLRLKSADPRPEPRGWKRLLLTFTTVAAVAIALAAPFWLLPAQAEGRPTLLAMVGEALTRAPAATTAPTGGSKREATPEAGPAPSASKDPTGQSSRIVLTVQLPQVLGVEPKTVRMLSMDALTRRLMKLDRFRQVQCDPVGEDRLQVALAFRATNAAGVYLPREIWPAVKRLIEQPGQLEFRRVHPDSDGLVARDECPAGYEVLAQATVSGPASRRFVVARDAVPGLRSTNLVESVVTRDPLNEEPRIAITFDANGARAFAELTRASVDRQIAVVVDGTLLMAPRVREAILGGKCEISGQFSEEEARWLAACLAYPLPAPLQLMPGNLPAMAPTSANPSGSTGDAAVAKPDSTLVQDAKLLYELGQLEEAKAKLEAALRQAPADQAAQYYLRLIREAEATKAARASSPSNGTPLLYPTIPPKPVEVPTNQLLTRTFRVDPNSIAPALAGMAGSGPTNLTTLEALRRWFAAAGLDFGGTNAFSLVSGATHPPVFQSPSGRAVFFNERNGILLVRATASDLEVVEQLLQVLNTAPPQVMIEAKFVEITDDANSMPGLDRFLAANLLNTNGAAGSADLSSTSGIPALNGTFPSAPPPIAPGSTSGVATRTGIMTDPQFRSALAVPEQDGTNGLRELRGDQLNWPGRDATNAASVKVHAALGAGVTGMLTDPQFRILLDGLNRRSGVDVLSAPRVTTLSGRQAQIQVVDLKTVLTGVNPAARQRLGAKPAADATPFTTAQFPVGPTLDVFPQVAADGTTIQLTVTATVTEFLGYDAPPKDAKVRVWEGGKSRLVDPPLPHFRVRQMQTQTSVGDGQTVVLGGFPVEDTRITKDKVPVLGDLPLAGGLFRSESKQAVRKRLLVFVTATLLDPAGNPVRNVAPPPPRPPPAP